VSKNNTGSLPLRGILPVTTLANLFNYVLVTKPNVYFIMCVEET